MKLIFTDFFFAPFARPSRLPKSRDRFCGSTLCVLCAFSLFLCGSTFAQDTTKTQKPKVKFSDIVRISGYVKNLNIVSFSNNPLIGNSNEQFLHNRINLRIYPVKNLTIGVEARNRFFYSGRTAETPAAKDLMGQDPGLIDMSWNIGNNVNPVHLNATIDRRWVAYGNDRVDLRIGRQRINWGVNLAWNPNDIFNAYNFIDFDYEERPGSDAVRFQYFGKKMRGFEIAVAPRANWEEATAAFMYKFNAKNYDFQLIAGQHKKDITAGFGFAGNLKNAGLKGELQWFGPYNGFSDSAHTVTGSVTVDYAFKNSLYINGAILYNSNGIDDSDPFALASFFSGAALDAKNLMPTKYNGFVMLTYPVTPLMNASFAVIYGYGPNLLLLNPSLTYSIVENWDVLLTAQLFFSDFPEITPTGIESKYQNLSNSVFLRLKWSY
ncbi:MAG: hypothetical protein JKX84_08485 [Flavobacteriales bacterium]|nr:hypothetical protein [Flavobacteriales bacterium]